MNWVVAIAVLAGLIVVHELGHYLVARYTKAAISDFSVGFGPMLWSRCDSRGTRWGIAALPLGGYVRMLSETETAPREIAGEYYERLSICARALIAVAGPLANLLFAFILLWMVALSGSTVLRAVLGPVPENSEAARAGLYTGDEVLAINDSPVEHYAEFAIGMVQLQGKTVQLSVRGQDGVARELQISLPQNIRKPSWMQEMGIGPPIQARPVLTDVVADSPAARAGLLVDDELLSFNGQRLERWSDWVWAIQEHPNEQVLLMVQRDDRVIPVEVFLGEEQDGGRLGVQVERLPWPDHLLLDYQFGPLEAGGEALKNLAQTFGLIVIGFVQLFSGQLGLEELGGPIAIVGYGAQAVDAGWEWTLRFAALISLSLMIINLLPFPGLDGGSLVLQGLEAIKGKPLSMRFRSLWGATGLVLLGCLMLLVVVNDILRFN